MEFILWMQLVACRAIEIVASRCHSDSVQACLRLSNIEGHWVCRDVFPINGKHDVGYIKGQRQRCIFLGEDNLAFEKITLHASSIHCSNVFTNILRLVAVA